MDRELILGTLDEIRIASCFDKTNCTNVRVGEYIFNNYFFTGVAVYKDGFECLVKERETIKAKSKQCVNQLVMSGEIKDMKQDSIFSAASFLINCTIAKFSCSEDEQFNLLGAAYNVIFLIEDFMHPEKILRKIGVSRDSISKKEIIEVLSYFASIF